MSNLVAVTGGAGFIGSDLLEGFLKKGYVVRTIDNLTRGSRTNLARIKTEVDFRSIDIRDLEALTEAFRDVSIVLHHAEISPVPFCFEDINYIHEVNVTGTLNVLTAAVRAGVRKVIYGSSSAVYGNNGTELQTEGAVPSPISPYGLSKWMGELYAAQFASSTSLETISLRYFNVFGPRQNLDTNEASVISRFIRKVAEGNCPVVYGDGSQTRDFTFVETIVEANLRAARLPLPSGAILNIATGKRTSLNDLVKMLNEIFGSQKQPVYEVERVGDIKHLRASTSLSTGLLGDYDSADFRDSLVRTSRWFLESAGRVQRCE